MPSLPVATWWWFVLSCPITWQMQTSDLDYELPADRVATQPVEPRDSARLMVTDRENGHIEHLAVRDLASPASMLCRGDLMVFNQTAVLPARFTATRTATRGQISGLYLESCQHNAGQWHVMLESGGKLQPGEHITLTDQPNPSRLELLEQHEDGHWRAKLHGQLSTFDLLHSIGAPPIPPYIRRARKARSESEINSRDNERYNSVLATEPGSVAAPTASLHFTQSLLEKLDQMGIRRVTLTLHIGLGTFAPIRTDNLQEHAMHREWIDIPAHTIQALAQTRLTGGRIIPVGTTCVRALESLPDPLPHDRYTAHTNLFITPSQTGRENFQFRFCDALMTNFHLPRSTLMALVGALPGVGIERLKQWYITAIKHKYRFYSYGDAMFVV